MRLDRKTRNKIGISIAAIGIGMLLAVFMPFWGWIIIAGAVLIYIGWNLAEHK